MSSPDGGTPIVRTDATRVLSNDLERRVVTHVLNTELTQALLSVPEAQAKLAQAYISPTRSSHDAVVTFSAKGSH